MDSFGVWFLGCRTCSQPCSRSSARLLQGSVPLLRSPFESRVPSEQAQPVRLLAEVATSGPPNWTRGHDGRRLTHLLSSVPGTGVGPTPPGRCLRCLEPNGNNHTKTPFFCVVVVPFRVHIPRVHIAHGAGRRFERLCAPTFSYPGARRKCSAEATGLLPGDP